MDLQARQPQAFPTPVEDPLTKVLRELICLSSLSATGTFPEFPFFFTTESSALFGRVSSGGSQ